MRAKAENRKQIAEAIAPANYLNQPATVLEQVLTGTFADGLGGVRKVPDRIDFDPFPWECFAVWMLTQMKRWGQLKGDVDYQGVAKQVFLATDAAQADEGGRPDAAGRATRRPSRDGQAVRPRQAGGLRQQLRHQAEGAEPCRRSRSGLREPALLLAALHLRAVPRCASGTSPPRGAGAAPAMDPEYAKLMGVTATTGKSAMPGPLDVGAKIWEHLRRSLLRPRHQRQGHRHPARLFDRPRRGSAYVLAVLVAIPLGFLIGMSPLMSRALDPFIQVLKPISPLAWMPLALYTIKDCGISAIFVIFICSLWPMLINTAFGVARVRKEWLNVARDAGGRAAAHAPSR